LVVIITEWVQTIVKIAMAQLVQKENKGNEGGQQMLHQEINLELYREDKRLGIGTLDITSKNITWNENHSGGGGDGGQSCILDYCNIILHAISRDTNAFPKECIYCQVDENSTSIEMRFVPSNRLQLDIIFQAFCEGARLNPDLDEDGNVKTDNEALNGLASMLSMMADMKSSESDANDADDNYELFDSKRNQEMMDKFDDMLKDDLL
jgi:hypothetical protein